MAIKRYVGDRFVGLSGDTKPTNVILGATFLETDTKDNLFFDGSSWVSLSSTTSSPTVISSAHTAQSGEWLLVDTSTSAITVTMPASPANGDYIRLMDYASTWDTNNVTLDRNGENFLDQDGSAIADNFILDVRNADVTFVYGSGGWRLRPIVGDAEGTNQNWIDISTTHTASKGEKIFADTSGGAFTITLPSTPNSGDFVIITDGALTFDTNNLTISRNGENILGLAEDLILNVENASVELVYRNATVGWLLIQR